MSHWKTTPSSDPRTWLPLAARGQRAPGHTGTPAACPRCAAELAAARVDPPAPPPPAAPPPATRRPSTPTTPGPQPPLSYTTRQLLLIAAGKVAAARDGVVPSGSLVMAAWQLAPDRFGLDLDGDRTKHPNSNAVLAKLAGADGLCGLGWLESTGRSLFRVTQRGQRELRALGAVATT